MIHIVLTMFSKNKIQISGDHLAYLKKGQIKSLNIPLLWRFIPPSQRLHFLLIVFKGMFS